MKIFFALAMSFLAITGSAEAFGNSLRRACLEVGGTPRVLDAGSADDLMVCHLRDGALIGAFDLLSVANGESTPAVEAYRAKSGCTGHLRTRRDSDLGEVILCEFAVGGEVSAMEATMLSNKRIYPELDRIIGNN